MARRGSNGNDLQDAEEAAGSILNHFDLVSSQRFHPCSKLLLPQLRRMRALRIVMANSISMR